jgi:hypothetical protein
MPVLGGMRRGILAAVVVAAGAAAPASAQRYGDVRFPQDEHMHQDGFDYWWGAADVTTASGHRYAVSVAYDNFAGYGASAGDVFPLDGPYKGRSLLTEEGPAEWGHAEQPAGRYVSTMSRYLPGISELLAFRTLDTSKHGKPISSWQRTTPASERYHLRIDDDAAKVHPTDERIRLGVDLDADMKSPPLLAGGTGRWWYGIPSYYHYPSRSFQYMQGARRLSGTIEVGQPDGTTRREAIDPERSRLEMVHEYDESPQDLFAGFALAESTQLHPRYAQYYEGGMPWELFFLDFDNGAQLMLAVLAFHDTPDGTLTPVVGADQPTYKVLATLRLPDGRSVALDDALHVEHLGYRTIAGQTPGPFIQVKGIWKQAWDFRVSFGGGGVRAGDGTVAKVPPFDLGLTPQLAKDEPKLGADGTGLTQRVPFDAAGSYGGCPIHGFGFTELIINWYGREARDPWYTGGAKPAVPRRCGAPVSSPPLGTTGDLTPPPTPMTPPSFKPERCQADGDGAATCAYTAESMGGVSGSGSEPGGWSVRIERPGQVDPIVIRGFGGPEVYACGTVRPGDHVTVTAKPGSSAFAGNPGICF